MNPEQIIKTVRKISLTRALKTKYGIFCGIPMRTSCIALYTLDVILTTLDPKRIVEIGTWNGGLTAYFQTWRNIKSTFQCNFMSVDIKDLRDPRIWDYTAAPFVKLDAFSSKGIFCIKHFLGDKSCLVYCDGGDKERELEIYSDFIPSGSIIGCHDYTTEVDPQKVGPMLQKKGFVEILSPEQVKQLGSLQQFWMKS